MKYVQPKSIMPEGVPFSQMRTVEAVENAVETIRAQIRSIQNQLMSGRPANPEDGLDLRVWEIRARDALKAKREMVEELVGAVALVREERHRQLVQMRLDRQEHARKMERVRLSNAGNETPMRFFRDEVRRRLSIEEYEDIWAVAKAAMQERDHAS